MASKVAEICEKEINPIIEELGYDVLEVEYAKKADGMNLSFIIDSPKGILIEDCEKVHRAIEGRLDEINPTMDATYILNVCSPGLDRPIKNQKDYLRNKNKQVEVGLFAPQDGKKKFQGTLTNFTDEIVEISQNGELLTFDRKKVSQVVPIIEF